MTGIVILNRADADIDGILSYLQREAGRSVAERYHSDFLRMIDAIQDFPMAGRLRPELGHSARSRSVYPYIIIYDYIASEDFAIVLRVLHGKRNIDLKLLNPKA